MEYCRVFCIQHNGENQENPFGTRGELRTRKSVNHVSADNLTSLPVTEF